MSAKHAARNDRPVYAVAALAVLAIEVLIALFVRDRFVRPLLGDTLAVLLVYLALRAATPLGVIPAAAIALCIAVAIEFGQLFGLRQMLGLEHSELARVVLGSGFDPRDFTAYGAGSVLAVVGEVLLRRPVLKTAP